MAAVLLAGLAPIRHAGRLDVTELLKGRPGDVRIEPGCRRGCCSDSGLAARGTSSTRGSDDGVEIPVTASLGARNFLRSGWRPLPLRLGFLYVLTFKSVGVAGIAGGASSGSS